MITSENSDFCLLPCFWQSITSGSCYHPKQLSNFQFVLAGLWHSGFRLSKASVYLVLHSPWSSQPCKEKCSLRCAICYFLTEDSSPTSQRSVLKWIFCSNGLHYLFFHDFDHLCQWVWFFTIIIRYAGCADECFLSQGISFLIWTQSGPEDINKGLGTETKV